MESERNDSLLRVAIVIVDYRLVLAVDLLMALAGIAIYFAKH